MPVVIAGMHRSGTSMVARLLNQSGLDLGPADHFIQPAADNPEGFWESLPFVQINEEIISAWHGSWHAVPDENSGWQFTEQFAPLRERAASIPGELGLQEPWGWKDPRNSITLPFWLSVWPDMKVVICLRNPLDVVNSLMERDQLPAGRVFRLWLDHQNRLLKTIRPEQRIITHYDSYFADPLVELRRVLEFLGLEPADDVLRSACSTISLRLRHSHFNNRDLESVSPSPELTTIYQQMCDEAGPVFASIKATSERPSALMVNAIHLMIKMEEQIAEQQQTIRDWEQRYQKLGNEGAEVVRRLDEMARWYEESRLFGEDRARQVRDYEELLSARRHRYAEKVAITLQKIGRPLRKGRGLKPKG
jgi:hypothetical protein